MKTKITLLISLFLTIHVAIATEKTEDCAVLISLFAEPAKIGNYDAALPYLKQLREQCPGFHLSMYQLGERLYKDRVEKSQAAEQRAEFEEYKKLWQERLQHFPDNTQEGTMNSTIAQVMFDNKIGTAAEQFDAFDRAYNSDKENFTSPKAIYTYFSLAIELYDVGQKEIQEVFDLYDEIINKIEDEENALATRITPLIEKQDNQENLSAQEERLLKAGETNLVSYSRVKSSVNAKLGILADCENLIPMYNRDFEDKKSDVEWLKNVNSRLSSKECTDDPIFFKVSQALHELQPSSRSAYSLGQLAEADGKRSLALEYYNQSAELEQDPNVKANTYYRIAENFRKAGSLSQARNFYRKAIDAKPSMGRAYLQIAAMYASSANDCGDTVFEKRAINWLAADLARTAARVDPSVASNANAAVESYLGRAPSKSDIFTDAMEGKTITFSCWVGGSVKVPKL
ncbi:MAG TPA: hypothetical protein VKX31_08555 [Brumimicrobium sp.]|nr:hypothetical protein [Brumimicrobium sp.]